MGHLFYSLPPKGGRFSPSSEFISAVMTLRLGAMVALIDDSLDQAEQKCP
jgi:hypothetical protein